MGLGQGVWGLWLSSCQHGVARGQSQPGVLPWAWWQGGAWGMAVPFQRCPMRSLMSPSSQGGHQPRCLAEGAVPGDSGGSGWRGTSAHRTDRAERECHPHLPLQGHPTPCPALLTPALPTQIFTVNQSYRIRLQFVITVDEVQSNSQNIRA